MDGNIALLALSRALGCSDARVRILRTAFRDGSCTASVLMSEVLGFSNPILPYESPPLVVALQLGGEPTAAAVKLCLAMGAVTLLLLYPLDYMWWRLLGWID